MRLGSCLVAAAGMLAAVTALAEVRVDFVNPRGFTDAGLYRPGPVGADAPALAGLRRIFERAGRRLPPGRHLEVEVVDVDLAGYFPPWQRSLSTPVRVMEDTTWPRIALRYTLTEDGRTLARGEAVLTDMAYLRRPAAARGTAPLRFEGPMIADWFDLRLGAAAPGTSAIRSR
jgi:hypothetical protein